MNQTVIGLAGCGRMGEPMLACMRAAGFEASGFDIRTPQSYGDFAPAMTDSASRFADNLETLFVVVRDIQQTDALLFDDQAMVDQAKHLRTIIICSTLSPRYVRGLRARVPDHIALVDAPMSGAAIAAREMRLSFMLGGDQAEVQPLMPLFEAMGTSIHVMGDFGAGMSAKVLNNLLAASSTAMTRLVLEWADQLEIDEQSLLQLIDSSSGQNWFARNFSDIEFARDGWSQDNTIGILEKDVMSALDAAPHGADTALPVAVMTAIRNLQARN